MRVIGRLLIALAIAFPASFVISSVASGDSGEGPAVIKCMHWEGIVNINPGATNTPVDQSVAGHGKLYGCNKAGGAAQFSGTFSMAGGTCSSLEMSGSGQLEWANGSHSTMFLSFAPQDLEPRKAFVSGTVTSGLYQGMIVRSWLRFTAEFQGSGVNCGPQNPLEKMRYTNSQSFQLLTPSVPDTTTPVTNEPPPNTEPSTPQTVPQTNGNGTTTPATSPPTNPTRLPPIVIIRDRGCCRGVVIVHRRFPTGTLAFTGSSRLAAVAGLLALLIGAAFVGLDPDRKKRGAARFSRRLRRPKKSFNVTLPPR